MRYELISADCHVDLCWLPPDLFVQNASPTLRERMPYVVDGPKGPTWTTKAGANLGRVNGMGSAGREYVPGKIHRADRMAATGLYDDGKKGIRRLTDPELRVKDQDRDGVQAEVLYGVLGASSRLNDPEAAAEVMRVYNERLADFCQAKPGRVPGRASIPHPPGAGRVGHRLDPLRAVAHGRRVGGPVQGPLAEDGPQRVLETPVLGDIPDRSDRREAHRRARRREDHVGLGLPAPGRRVARL